MKKIGLLIVALLTICVCHAQIIDYHENMETIDSVFSTGNPGWFANQRLAVSGVQCDSSHITSGDTSLLETMSINLTGKTYVTLQFKHICKVSFFDSAFVEVFNGTNWIMLTAANMVAGQPDSATFAGLGNKFSEASFLDWQPGQATLPDNTWWKTEAFDLSSLLGNVANAKVRWKLFDAGAPGGDNRAGWFLDDIQLLAAPCELTPPLIVQNAPLFQNVVLFTGPFTLNATITDASGLDTASLALFYSVNGSTFVSSPLTYVSGNNFSAMIPQVSDSDTICYYFSANDASACNNNSLFPATGCTQFVARSGISLPFCDGFDFSNFWTDSTSSGSPWQLGVPVTSPPNAHSAPNVWEVALNAQYTNSTTTYLYSPVMNFGNITNANVNFWFYKDCELGWDGTRIDYSIDGGVNWLVLGSVGTGINWYSDAQLNSSLQPAWTGVGSAWSYAEHSLAVLDNQQQSRLRFVFTSDISVAGNGFAIDDFCIDVPVMIDASLDSLIQPPATAVAGQCIPVQVSVTNVGQQPLNSLNVSCSLNNGVPVTVTYTGNIAPGASVLVTLPCLVIPSGGYTICAWLSGVDTNPSNDSLCKSLIGVPVIPVSDSVGYCDNFDVTNVGWYSEFLINVNVNTKWQLGAPNYGVTTGAHSGTQSWDINLTTKYFGDAGTVLYSPYFDVSANTNPFVSFWHNMSTELVWDAILLEYNLDSSATWTTLGLMGDTASTNWYGYNGSGQPIGWSGLSAGWKFSQYRDMSFANGHVIQFRFVFISDGSIEGDGFSMDDFCFGRDTAIATSVNFLQQEINELDLQAMPNPARDRLKVNYFIPENGFVKLEVMDVTGRTVLDLVNDKKSKGYYSVDLETHAMSDGVYFYRLTCEGNSIVKKVAIRK